MRTLYHKIPALVLTLALILCPLFQALAAETAGTASTVQLSRTEGTVTVTNSGGKALTQLADMRLYNGNTVATEAESYAWLTLDSTKLNKLDAVSEAELRKSGKKLEVLLNKGNLFFNVTKPLEDQETLNIRTSTMVVGIRGTCGWVKVIDQHNTLVYVLEGTVWCTVTDPLSGQSKTTALSGGETARFTVYDRDWAGDKCGIIRERFTEEDIDGFVLAELLGDGPMCEKIYADSGLDLRDLTEEAVRERLERDQAETAEKLREQEELAAGQDRNISKDPVWTKSEEPSAPGTPSRGTGGGSSSGGAPSTPSEPSNPSTPVTPSDVARLTMPVTDMEIQQALNRPNVRQVIVSPGTDPARNTLDIGINMDVAAGKTLTLESGVPAQVRGGLNVDGTADFRDNLDNPAGTVTVNSANTLRVGGDLTNGSALAVTATGRTVVEGSLVNRGTLALTEGARVLARGFDLNPGADGWSVSGTADGDGYYILAYTGVPEPEPVTEELGDFKVTSTGTEYEYADNVLTITGPTPVTISMRDGVTQTTADTIFVAGGVSADITLDGVDIDVSGNQRIAAFEISSDSPGDITLTLSGDNSLKSGAGRAGVDKGGLTTGTLTIQGDGALEAVGGYGLPGGGDMGGYPAAGIGSNGADACRNITIAGNVEITAAGGDSSPGIGSPYTQNISISGGIVNSGVAAESLTMTGGTVNGNVSVADGTFTMTDGKIKGSVDMNTGKLTISGGEIVSSGAYTIRAASTVTSEVELYINGGTITNENDAGNAVLWPSESAITSLYLQGGAVRGKNTNLLSHSLSEFKTVQRGDYYYLAKNENTGDFMVTGGTLGVDYIFTTPPAGDDAGASIRGILEIRTSTPLTISGTTTQDIIYIGDGVSANLTLAGVSISNTSYTPLEIVENSTGNVTITLLGENTLSSTSSGAAALQKNGSGGSLTINGSGTLRASGGSGAPGIGSANAGSYPISIQENGVISVTAAAGTYFCIGAGSEYTAVSGWNGVVARSHYTPGGDTASQDTFTVYGQVTLTGEPLNVNSYPIVMASEDAYLRGSREDFLTGLPAGWKMEQREDGYYYLAQNTNSFMVAGGTYGGDYHVERRSDTVNVLVVKSKTPLMVSPRSSELITDSNIRIDSPSGADITLDNLDVKLDISTLGITAASGEVTLAEQVTLPADCTLTMEAGASLKGAELLTNLPIGWQSVQGEDGNYYLQQEVTP